MKNEKIMSIVLVGIMAIGLSAMAFADSPQEIYSDLSGLSQEEAWNLRNDLDKTFGELAEENGFYDEFFTLNQADKFEMIDEKVADGTISLEEATDLKASLENCDGSQMNLLEGIGFRRGASNEKGQGLRDGSNGQMERASENSAPKGMGNGRR